MKAEGLQRAPARGRRRAVPAGLVLAGVLSVFGCAPDPVVGAPLPLVRGGAGTYSALSRDLFVPRCASTSCHGGSVFPRLDAASGWAAMVNVQSQEEVIMLVAPGAPEQSWLLVRLRGEGGRPYMPRGGAQLSPSEIAAVEGWIANGAPND